MVIKSSRVLARLRCLSECSQALMKGTAVPEGVCYVPEVVEYKTKKSTSLSLYSKPNTTSKKTEMFFTPKHRLLLASEEQCSAEGRWKRVHKIFEGGNEMKSTEDEKWILLPNEEVLFPVKIGGSGDLEINCWEELIDHTFLAHSDPKKVMKVAPSDERISSQLRTVPPSWTLKHDEELALMLSTSTVDSDDINLNLTDYVDSVETNADNNDVGYLLDGDVNNSWYGSKSDGSGVTLTLNMKEDTIIKSLTVCFLSENEYDRSSSPRFPIEVKVICDGKPSESDADPLKITYDKMSNFCFTLLSGQCRHIKCIKLIFTVRPDMYLAILGFKISGFLNGADGSLSKNTFTSKKLVSHPLLSNIDPEILYHRALLLKRIVELFDSVLVYLVPTWEYSVGSFGFLPILQMLIPMSEKRTTLVNAILKQTEETRGSSVSLVIRRPLANSNEKTKPETVFNQIYNGLTCNEEKSEFNFRVSSSIRQWWTCMFVGEGIIDQGGGFRDTISDIAEELCPSNPDSPLLLPFFIPSPNQQNPSASDFRDTYIPNPSCTDFHKLEWIGKLMGGCLRSNERLAITLPVFFWKMLADRPVVWSDDYLSVDGIEVKIINSMDDMDSESFEERMRTWNVVLSDGTSVPLKPNGEELIVLYDERNDYVRLTKETRMNEFKRQVSAIRTGLLDVVPQAVLQLLSAKELEMKICSCSEISMEELKRNVIFLDKSYQQSESAKFFWQVLQNFSSKDRSQFLRFATGRQRLPVKVFVEKVGETDILPTSSTCANHFYLPNYTSAKAAEDKIRLAIYDCKFIDTDTSIFE